MHSDGSDTSQGENRTKRWPDAPTVKQLGYDLISSSPYGQTGPAGIDPEVVKILHDTFKRDMDDPRHTELLDQLNHEAWYKNSADYAAFVRNAQQEEAERMTSLGRRTMFWKRRAADGLSPRFAITR